MTLCATERTHVKRVEQWQNFHCTTDPISIEEYCTTLGSDMRGHGASITEILDYCFLNNLPFRPIGARWSLSPIGIPERVAHDTANLELCNQIGGDWLTAAYKDARPNHALVLAQGGATVASLNRRLGAMGLALQTSGASDAHRIAGAIATATHGAAVKIGAIHDTVLALHVVVAPRKALFVQPSDPVCTPAVASWLGANLGIPTENVCDDETLRACQVHLGALGLVHAVAIDAVPLYMLRRRIVHTRWRNPDVWDALERFSSSLIPDIYHAQVIFNPYPSESDDVGTSAVLNIMDKVAAPPGETPPPTTTATAVINSDLMSALGNLVLPLDVDPAILRPIIQRQIQKVYPEGEVVRYPGNMFGPTTLAPGKGMSTEIFFDHANLRRVLTLLRTTLRDHGRQWGRRLGGGLGARVIKGSSALLAMNRWPLTGTIEIPSIKANHVQAIYDRIYENLKQANIEFVCHWGQQHKMDAAAVQAKYGASADAWRKVRKRVLDARGQSVFGSEHLRALGLDR